MFIPDALSRAPLPIDALSELATKAEPFEELYLMHDIDSCYKLASEITASKFFSAIDLQTFMIAVEAKREVRLAKRLQKIISPPELFMLDSAFYERNLCQQQDKLMVSKKRRLMAERSSVDLLLCAMGAQSHVAGATKPVQVQCCQETRV
jgi:hypothetical protein